MKKGIELVAPAGNLRQVGLVLDAGADAVYLGLKETSSRPSICDLEFSEIQEATSLVKERGRKIYLALNKGISPGEEAIWEEVLERLGHLPLDALILSSPDLINLLRERGISFPLHASSLLAVYNSQAVSFLKKLGFRRVTPSNSLFADELYQIIASHPDMEFQILALGGVCFHDTHRCRLPHFLISQDKFFVYCKEEMELLDQERKVIREGRLTAGKPINVIPSLPLYISLGVKAFKIIGRERSDEFVSQATAFFRRALDNLQ